MYDTMKFLYLRRARPSASARPCSAARVLLAAGTKGKRYALPHAKVMIHQPFGGICGQTEDIAIQAEEILKTKKTELTRSSPTSPASPSNASRPTGARQVLHRRRSRQVRPCRRSPDRAPQGRCLILPGPVIEYRAT